MGSGTSKPAGDHVFTASGPVTFSQQVLDSLQSSPETDSTRARAIESHIQARVQSELSKLRDVESARLSDLAASLTPSAASAEDEQPASLHDRISAADARSHDSVKKEIGELKAKLASRRKAEEPSGEVVRAKEELVRCLRVNDRRPLDCWAEVEAFKREVGELERGFVERTLR